MASEAQEPTPRQGPSERVPLAGVALAIVAVAVVLWIGMAVWTATAADAGDRTWVRLAFVLTSVQAIAFVAAGALFGASVQRERVFHAEERARRAAADADNGRALAALVLANEGRVVENDAGYALVEEASAVDDPGARLRRQYADAARLLFPDAPSRSKSTAG